MLFKQVAAGFGEEKSAGQGVLSEPIENLIQDQPAGLIGINDQDGKAWPVHVLVVGSGYGGAIAAMRLASKKCNVVVFERGKEYATGQFPETLQEAPAHIQFLRNDKDLPIGNADALFDFRLGNPISVLVGCGLGGTSLINANVAMEPGSDLFDDPRWPSELHRQELRSSFDDVTKLLGVTQYDSFLRPHYKKYSALARLASDLGSTGAPCKPAPIAVTFKDGKNAVGIEQKACIGCGNCVTGCNYEAKNTLPMNALPLAKCRGARMFTGATVLSIEPAGLVDGSDGWIVRFRRTETAKTTLQTEVFSLHTAVVVLAAGTLGSTEILLRSEERSGGEIKFSKSLGTGFSTNGDAIAFGYAQKQPVNAVAKLNKGHNEHDVGPTITGYIRARAGDGVRSEVTIEDGAVPSVLARLFEEVLVTASVFKRNFNVSLPAWFHGRDGKGKDPLSVHLGAVDHSQVLLVMGDDEARGLLKLGPRDEETKYDPDRFRISIEEPPEGVRRQEPPVFQAVDKLFEEAEKSGGFDGGDYLPNPFWKILPADITQASNAPAPGRNLLSVHPLGGCPMGSDVQTGVVNHAGQVFRLDGPRKDSLYEGLYVMDGAIIPCALGVNPFLTIAALAYRNARKLVESHNEALVEEFKKTFGGVYRVQFVAEYQEKNGHEPDRNDVEEFEKKHIEGLEKRFRGVPIRELVEKFKEGGGRAINDKLVETFKKTHGWTAQDLLQPGETPQPQQPQGSPRKEGSSNNPVKAKFNEVMTGELSLSAKEGVPPWIIKNIGKRASRLNEKDRLAIKVQIHIDDVLAWLREPNKPLDASATLYLNEKGQINPVREEKLIELGVCQKANGKVRLFAWDKPCGCLHQAWRALLAIVAFVRRRGITNSFDIEANNSLDKITKGIKMLVGFLRAAWNTANWRYLEYRFTFENERGWVGLHGTKELAYACKKKNPWDALTDLPFTLYQSCKAVRGELRVDVVGLTKKAPFQAMYSQDSPDSPSTIAALVSAGLMFFRVVFQTHFWSFGAPNYPKQKIEADRQPKPIQDSSGSIDPKPIDLPVPTSRREWNKKLNLRLVRYERKNPSRGSILLIHGLASGSRVFATPSIPENFATYLYKLGYDVWLFDYRVSIALPGRIAEGQWDMDQIGEFDMHEAVKRVYDETGGPVQVFAHCVGAAALAMGILSGRCHDHEKNQSRISALALHAVQPWPVPSPVNHVKANFAAVIRDALTWKRLDAVLPHKPTAFDVMLDRIGGSIPFPSALEQDYEIHRKQTDPVNMGRNICDRMTLYYGWEWNHARDLGGLNEVTHLKLADLVGVANFETFRHIYFLLTRKRLTTRMGEDTYVKAENFRDYWKFPTLFAHGKDNQLYDPRSAITSCRRLQDLRRQEGHPPGPTGAYHVYWFEADHCGHFDFLFGKDANEIVYPSVSAFFHQYLPLNRQSRKPKTELEQEAWNKLAAKTKKLETERDPFWDYNPIPYRGPIIGHARPHETKQDTIAIRVWVEPYRFSARQAFVGKVAQHPPRVNITPCELPRTEPVSPAKEGDPIRDYPGTYWVYDLEIPNDYDKDLFVWIENLDAAPWIQFRVDEVRQLTYAQFERELEAGVVEEVSLTERFIRGRQRTDGPHSDDNPQWEAFIAPREADPKLPSKLKAKPVRETDMTGYIWLTKWDWFKHIQRKPTKESTAFLVGSCRYPGSPFDENMADRVFDAMTRHIEDSPQAGPGVDHVLLVGDQIYADATADIFDTKELRERFSSQYRQAFGARHLRRLLASLPTYMALDDHEFGDNWTGDSDDPLPLDDAFVRRFGENFQYGLAAAMAYQWSMGPRSGWQWPPEPDPDVAVSVHNQGLWYQFESGGLPFFVMDTRTERSSRCANNPWTKAEIVGPRQMKALTKWLTEQDPGKPKFIVSGSVLAPVSKSHEAQNGEKGENWLYRNHDGWAGFPATWKALAQHIVKYQIQKVVFLAGDYHFSAVAELTLSSDDLKKAELKEPVKAYQIVASGLFVPLPFANAKEQDYGWGRPGKLPFSDAMATITFKPYLLTTSRSHFLRVKAEPGGTMSVSVWGGAGAIDIEESVLKKLREGPFEGDEGEKNTVRWSL